METILNKDIHSFIHEYSIRKSFIHIKTIYLRYDDFHTPEELKNLYIQTQKN